MGTSINSSPTSETNRNVTIATSDTNRRNYGCVRCDGCYENCSYRSPRAPIVGPVNNILQAGKVEKKEYGWTSPYEYSYRYSDSSPMAYIDDDEDIAHCPDTAATSFKKTASSTEKCKRIESVIPDDSDRVETIDSAEAIADEEFNIDRLSSTTDLVDKSIVSGLEKVSDDEEGHSRVVADQDKIKGDSGTMVESTSQEGDENRKRNEPEKYVEECMQNDRLTAARTFAEDLLKDTEINESIDSDLCLHQYGETKEHNMETHGRSFATIRSPKLWKKWRNEKESFTKSRQDVLSKEANKIANELRGILSRNAKDNGSKHSKCASHKLQEQPETRRRNLRKVFSKIISSKAKEIHESKSGKRTEQTESCEKARERKADERIGEVMLKCFKRNTDQPGLNDIKREENRERMNRKMNIVRKGDSQLKKTVKTLSEDIWKGLLIVLRWMKNRKNAASRESDSCDSGFMVDGVEDHVAHYRENAEKYRKIARALDVDHEDLEGALRMYERAINELKKTKSTANKYYGRVLFEYALALHKLGRRTESNEYCEKAFRAGFILFDHDFSQDLRAARHSESSAQVL